MELALANAARRLGVLVLGLLCVVGSLLVRDWLRPSSAAHATRPVGASALALGALVLVGLAALAWRAAEASLERAETSGAVRPRACEAYRLSARPLRGDSPELPVAARKAALSLMLLSIAMAVVIVAAVVR